MITVLVVLSPKWEELGRMQFWTLPRAGDRVMIPPDGKVRRTSHTYEVVLATHTAGPISGSYASAPGTIELLVKEPMEKT